MLIDAGSIGRKIHDIENFEFFSDKNFLDGCIHVLKMIKRDLYQNTLT